MKTSEVLYTPLDIPRIQNREVILRAFDNPTDYVWWDEETLLGDKDPRYPLGSKAYGWKTGIKKKYAEIVQLIEEFLPFESLFYVRIARARHSIPPHVDENYETPLFTHHMPAARRFLDHQEALEPIGYRFIISGSRDTMYLCEKYDRTYQSNDPGAKMFVSIPEETDFFLIRNSQQPHGVDINHLDSDRLVGFVLGYLDSKKHIELITKSCEKFRRYSVTREQFSKHIGLQKTLP